VENAWQASTGSISRGKDKFLIGPRYTDDSLLVDLITPRYGGLYKAPSTARILITFCLKPAKLFFLEREGGALSTSPPSSGSSRPSSSSSSSSSYPRGLESKTGA